MGVSKSWSDGDSGSDWNTGRVSVTEKETIDGSLVDVDVDEDLLLNRGENGISTPREVGKLFWVDSESNWSLIFGMGVLGLILIVPQSWEIVVLNRAVTTKSGYSRSALALSGLDVTLSSQSSSNVTVTWLASQLVIAVKAVKTVGTLVARPSVGVLLAHTLSGFQVASV